ncbi:YggW family oxidoreductase [Alcanivorax sp. HI0033]|uniref:radical SAM family heme chaperone HemW n=1 Tax=unclassified Alcanivorax TaxID=2638842 RepID=UPI0007B79EA3|nr:MULTISPECIES: radical SAM family heme chaperone HemW [unclassified Alcanivorax]KZX77222.1 YggW family oxidoreductase [Alcanivorax sp. HI0011]KZX92419.1 YggW family oxidoreductase [Alcanivorax sp. HI0013]KZY15423.1 YggW family oxidoreductase [Alcanivorax sp. HI0035]KZX67088.1 YggW family oxidoreductase [Alcanivorax sp. HI0007]KZX68545.1 YggW family oxidoreductase [Alcanivorax sp. HI0003]
MPLKNPPLSLYIHTPWCVRKCPYCDFNSHERGELPEAAYLRALLADLDQDLPLIGDRTVETVFIGGGTPSLLSGDFYRQLFQGIRQRLLLSEQAEITLEANPGTVEAGRFAGFREAGINRLSIGVQSFNNTHLQALGRIHDASAAIQAARQAREAGFTTFNLDIMHALPGQTRAQALDDLQQAMALQPTHLSWYELTIEPNTVFFRSPPDQPSPDHMADTEQEGFALLASQGYQRYEVSAFARDGHACRHNLNYWQFGDYLGIGAGAHGKITDTHHGTIHRYQKTRKPEDYLADPQQARRQYHPVAREDRLFEALMNGLRLVEGVRLQTVEDNTGLPAAQWTHYLGELRQQGLLEITDQRVHCTEKGMHHLNGVLARLAEALS